MRLLAGQQLEPLKTQEDNIYIDEAQGLLSGVPQYMLAKLQLVQSNAARIIVRKRKSDHISLTLKELHWLPIEARVEFKILLLTFKALNGTAPLYLSNLVQIKENACVLRSGSEQYLEVPPTRSLDQEMSSTFVFFLTSDTAS